MHFPKKEKLPTIKNSASAANPTELVYGDTVVEKEDLKKFQTMLILLFLL